MKVQKSMHRADLSEINVEGKVHSENSLKAIVSKIRDDKEYSILLKAIEEGNLSQVKDKLNDIIRGERDYLQLAIADFITPGPKDCTEPNCQCDACGDDTSSKSIC